MNTACNVDVRANSYLVVASLNRSSRGAGLDVSTVDIGSDWGCSGFLGIFTVSNRNSVVGGSGTSLIDVGTA